MSPETKALIERYWDIPPGFYPKIFSCPCDKNDQLDFFQSNDDQIKAWLERHKECKFDSKRMF